MLKRFILAFLSFIGLIVPGAFLLALLVAPGKPGRPAEQPGCDRTVANANASRRGLAGAREKRRQRARRRNLQHHPPVFSGMVKARAIIAVCRTGPDRERELGRLDADVEHINEAIAASCS